MQGEKTGMKLGCGQGKNEKEQRKKRKDKLGWMKGSTLPFPMGLPLQNQEAGLGSQQVEFRADSGGTVPAEMACIRQTLNPNKSHSGDLSETAAVDG